MVGEYADQLYAPAARQGRRFAADGFSPARAFAAWKAHVHPAWQGVRLARLDTPRPRLGFGETLRIEIALYSNGLSPEDVTVEAILGRPASGRGSSLERHYAFSHAGHTDDGALRFALDLSPERCGKLEYRIRAFPSHPLLTHKFEIGLMSWL